MTVTHIGETVVAALRAAGYQESTIEQYRKSVRLLDAFVADRGGVYTPELGAGFARLTVSPRTGRFSAQRRFGFGRLVRVFDSYVRDGVVDLRVARAGGGGPRPVSAGFAALVDRWEADMAERGLAASTVRLYGRNARDYLVFLESRGVHELGEAAAASVPAFLESLLDRWARSSLPWVVSNFRPFLTFTGRADLVAALNFAGMKRHRALVPGFSDADTQRIVATCSGDRVSARDGAITLLALMTGLRACDIIGLRITDIDWHSRTISIVQQKTRNPLTLPVPDVLADRLAAYLLGERPASGGGHVFLRSVAPHEPLAGHAAIHVITRKTLARAGLTHGEGGTQFLRHAAASRMIAGATPVSVIQAVLGHASIESTNLYMSVDEKRLAECVLPVPAGARS